MPLVGGTGIPLVTGGGKLMVGITMGSIGGIEGISLYYLRYLDSKRYLDLPPRQKSEMCVILNKHEGYKTSQKFLPVFALPRLNSELK